MITLITATISCLYLTFKVNNPKRFLNILSNAMAISFFFILTISLFKASQKEYNLNMEVIFLATILIYIITIILYQFNNIFRVYNFFLRLFKIALLVSSLILVFSNMLFKNIPNYDFNSTWIIGLFLISCLNFIKIIDYDNSNKK